MSSTNLLQDPAARKALALARQIDFWVSNGWPASVDPDEKYARLDAMLDELGEATTLAIWAVVEA